MHHGKQHIQKVNLLKIDLPLDFLGCGQVFDNWENQNLMIDF